MMGGRHGEGMTKREGMIGRREKGSQRIAEDRRGKREGARDEGRRGMDGRVWACVLMYSST